MCLSLTSDNEQLQKKFTKKIHGRHYFNQVEIDNSQKPIKKSKK